MLTDVTVDSLNDRIEQPKACHKHGSSIGENTELLLSCAKARCDPASHEDDSSGRNVLPRTSGATSAVHSNGIPGSVYPNLDKTMALQETIPSFAIALV
jgi:hypothetical protein